MAAPAAPPAAAKSQAAPPAAPPAGAPPPSSPAGANLGQNKENEPQFQMKLEPESKVVFKGDKLAESEAVVPVKLTNTTKARQCFKVKTTSNDIFRVRPPLGFVAPNETVTINIVFAAKEVPAPNRHFFAFYHIPCKDDDKNPRAVWGPSAKPEGVRRIVTDFVKEDGTAVTADKNNNAAASPTPPAAAPAGGAPPPAAAAGAAPAAAPAKSAAAPPAAAPPAAAPAAAAPEKK
uniref:Major sperm protein n=1 Tax=Panagrolaimus superbus TaxID=310955 RepID=A0A914YAS8_9BILA